MAKPDLLIEDEDDWCRACGGTGGPREDNGYGSLIQIPCHLCDGSGKRTVRVSERAPDHKSDLNFL